ncbi:phosphatidylinositol 4-phosphate 5-kinase-like protein 1 isoform X2 [Pseudonaja textilis]|uniref:phosphatidylinositol 4-phosphate 5-kinase-like protein 1 isoform X2 n=1 Tax=Pseudonaja textilis TaxID=8673 RepID=UPI000EAA9F93|nr:phosphatidylinositol 4-phosphate 5-kinase-like protein 1 isoform X2 [Pseudonaja textilis]
MDSMMQVKVSLRILFSSILFPLCCCLSKRQAVGLFLSLSLLIPLPRGLANTAPPSALQSSVSYRRPYRTWSATQRMLCRVRQQWKMQGFFEINEQHDFFQFTRMLKQGLKASIQKTIDEPASMESQRPSDFTRVLKQTHEGYEMRTYAAPVFSRFRQYLGMADTDFQMSLTCESAYLQFISNSKSQADFFLTFDKRFFLKTQRKREIRFLLTNLSKYLDHMERYPHSILVKFLGVYSIIAPQEKKRYFIIMQSVFYPHERITERSVSYDYPRRHIARATSNSSSSSSSSDQILRLYPDYLLSYLKPDRPPEQLIQSEGFMHNVVTPFLMQSSCEDMSCTVGRALYSSSLSDLSSASFAAQHRRILPHSKNPLHTIDGPDYRYYVGIIDLFTVYTFRKKLEHLWKSIRYRGQQSSTVEPSCYAQRLCQWVESHTI